MENTSAPQHQSQYSTSQITSTSHINTAPQMSHVSQAADYYRPGDLQYAQMYGNYSAPGMGTWSEAHARFPMFGGGSFVDDLGRSADAKHLGMGVPPQLNTYSYEVDGQRYSLPLDYDPYSVFPGTDMQGAKIEPGNYYGNIPYMSRPEGSYTATGSDNTGPLNYSQSASVIPTSNTAAGNTGLSIMNNTNSANYTNTSGALNMVNKSAKETDIVANALNQSQITSSVNKVDPNFEVNEANSVHNQFNALNRPDSASNQSKPSDKPDTGSDHSADESSKDGTETVMYKCTICHKKYSTKKSLQRHSAIHPENKSHECEICNKNFGSMSFLMIHLKTHMKESYFCSYCDDRFSTIPALKTHLQIHAVDNMLNVSKSSGIIRISEKKEPKASDKKVVGKNKNSPLKENEASKGGKRSLDNMEESIDKKRKIDEDASDEERDEGETSEKQKQEKTPDKQIQPKETVGEISVVQDTEFRKADPDMSKVMFSDNTSNEMHASNGTNLMASAVEQGSEICLRTDHENIKLNKRVELGENGNEMYIRTDIIEDGQVLEAGEDDEIQIKKEPLSEDEHEICAAEKELMKTFLETKVLAEVNVKKEAESEDDNAVEENKEEVTEEEEGEEEGEEGDDEEEGSDNEEDGSGGEESDVDGEVILPCGFCNEKFNDPEELLLHLEMHRDTNTYSYEVDGKIYTAAFTDKAEEDESDPEFTPKTSGKKTKPSRASKSNDANVDQEITPEPPVIDPVTGEKVYKCHICPKEYSRANSLKRHLILHTGEKPHQCPHCPRKFALVSYLTEHVKTHTGKLPFQCKICKKYFNRLANMKVHMGIHLKEKQDKQEQERFQKQLAAGEIEPSVLPGDHKAMASVLKAYAGDGSDKAGSDILAYSDILSGAIELANKSGKPNNQILLIDKSGGMTNNAVLLKTTSAGSSSAASTSSSANQSLISLKQQIIEKAIKKLDKTTEPTHSKTRKGLKDEMTATPEDTEEMNLFKPYLNNYLGDGEGKKDETTHIGTYSPDENDEMNRKNTSTEVETNVKDESSLDLTGQVMQIINMKSENNKGNGELEEERSDTERNEELEEDQNKAKDENSETPEKALYTYVLEGKTFQIPLETYTSLIKLDRQLESEGAKNEVLIQQFGMITQTDESGKKVYTCELCQKSYSRSNSLRRHLLVHTGEKAYACDLCDKKFSIKSYLTAHRKIHSGETPFGCTLCFKQFNRVSNLRAHMLVHTGAKPHSCEVCGKLFNLSSNLKRHMTIHSGLKPHLCTVCGKEFGLSSSLKEHMRVHTGENPYKCEICGKVFKQHSNFRRHKSIHTGVKKHVCHICNKAFNQSGSLKRHLTIHPETAGCLDFESQLEDLETEESMLGDEEDDEEISNTKEDVNIEDNEITDSISETINRIVESNLPGSSTTEDGKLSIETTDETNENDHDANAENYYTQSQKMDVKIKNKAREQTPSKPGVNGLRKSSRKGIPKRVATINLNNSDGRKSETDKVEGEPDLGMSSAGQMTDNKISAKTTKTSDNMSGKISGQLEFQADQNISQSKRQNFMPEMNNISLDPSPSANTPNTLSKEDQIKQMEWYHKKYTSSTYK